MAVEDEFNKTGEELDLGEIESNVVNNVVPRPEEFDKSSTSNTHFLGPRYVLAGQTTNFSFEFIPRKTMTFEEISVAPISQTTYILNIYEPVIKNKYLNIGKEA